MKLRPKSVPKKRSGERGFTLIEIVVAIGVLGLISITLAPAFKSFMAARDLAYQAEQTTINRKIANALMARASAGPVRRNYSAPYVEEADGVPGFLQAPCTVSGSKAFYTVYNPSLAPTACKNTTYLTEYLLQQGLDLATINHDGTAGRRVRVYQKVGNLSQETFPLGKGGLSIFLEYDIGVVYLTNCRFNDPCNQSASTTNPPRSSNPSNSADTEAYAQRLTSSNFSTWKPGTYDVGAIMVSTLADQRLKLDATIKSVFELRDAFKQYYAAKQAAAPTSTANFYPQPSSNVNIASSLTPDNEGCWEGWYDLGLNQTDLLTQIGLFNPAYPSESTYGNTAWGGPVQFCRDYDPSGTSGYGNPPHFAALRFHKAISTPPDDRQFPPGQSAIISF